MPEPAPNLTQTGLVRWYNGVLQQQWYNSASGANTWEDVPHEGNSAAKPRGKPSTAKRKAKR